MLWLTASQSGVLNATIEWLGSVPRGARVFRRADHHDDGARRRDRPPAGPETGADDYVCKPFSPRELIARVGVILCRVHRAPAEPASIIEIDDTARDARIRGESLDLTPTEYPLFSTMARRPGTIWSRARLLELVRPDALAVGDRTIDSHIKNLRRKLDAQLGVEVVESVYGVGYRVELPPAS